MLLNKWSSCTTALHRWNKWSKWLTLSHFSSRREEVMGQLSLDTKSFYIFHFYHISVLKWSAWEKVLQRFALTVIKQGEESLKKNVFYRTLPEKFRECPNLLALFSNFIVGQEKMPFLQYCHCSELWTAFRLFSKFWTISHFSNLLQSFLVIGQCLKKILFFHGLIPYFEQ